MNNQHKAILISLVLFGAILSAASLLAAEALGSKLAGRILLQVEGKGEAWYVNPLDQKRSYLGRPADALATIRRLGMGATNADLFYIPVGLTPVNGKDSDGDGLNDDLEEAVGTHVYDKDTDKDGFSDKVELEKQFNPLGWGPLNLNQGLISRLKGKILLQVEDKGQAWYINPIDSKRYYLGSPATALAVMRQLGLGITNKNLEMITIDYSYLTIDNSKPTSTSVSVLNAAADAIRANDTGKTLTYFTPSMQRQISHTMGFLNSDGKLTFANMLSGAQKTSETSTQMTYSAEVFFSLGGYKVTVNFYLEKQPDGHWLISKI
jgi:hypothetical protein